MQDNQPGKLRNIHGQTNGNAMIFVVIVLFTLVCFFVFTIHVGQRVSTKIAMQNAADASVISGAVWQARGLNLISLLNVTMTECLALIIMFKAFDSTLTYANVLYPINLAAFKACNDFDENQENDCCDIYNMMLDGMVRDFLDTLEEINEDMKETYDEETETLWAFMGALKEVEEVVSTAFPEMALKDASRIASLNGADQIAVVEGESCHAAFSPVIAKLPVVDGEFKTDLCEHTWYKTTPWFGYEHYLCIDSAMDVEMLRDAGAFKEKVNDLLEEVWDEIGFFKPSLKEEYYRNLLDLHHQALCSPGDSGTVSGEYEMATVNCDKCVDEGGRSEWIGVKYSVKEAKCDLSDIEENARSEHFLGRKTYYNGEIPTFTKTQTNIVETTQDGRDTFSDPSEAQTCQICCATGFQSGGTIEVWTLERCFYGITVSLDREDVSYRPKPLILQNDWEDQLKFTSLVYRDGTGATPPSNNDGSLYYSYRGENHEPVLSLRSNMSGELVTYGNQGNSEQNSGSSVEIPANTWSIARAEVYNYQDVDLFNQNWHAKLIPCDFESLGPDSVYGNNLLPDPLRQGLSNSQKEAVEEVLVH